ncbi:MAG: hypothetical protein IIA40_06320 [SAR324 cluster bacterium]|nr:hypothetical protein [SAR324 cluster bacterium]
MRDGEFALSSREPPSSERAVKLNVTDWKTAWFDAHIADRFFQEMAKVDKGALKNLATSAQWMEQIMIDVGQLAQAMIQLESDGAPEPQIRNACDKALRLSALTLQLMTTLAGVDRDHLRSGSSSYSGSPSSDISHVAPLHPAPPQTGPLQDAPPPGPSIATPAESAQHHAVGAAQGLPPLWGQASHFPLPGSKPAETAESPEATGPPDGSDTRSAEEADTGVAQADSSTHVAPPALTISSLMQISGRKSIQSESTIRETIRSLSQQGLSRAEIEMVTGEPRDIVEAVLEHERGGSPNVASEGSGA